MKPIEIYIQEVYKKYEEMKKNGIEMERVDMTPHYKVHQKKIKTTK